VKPTSSFLPVSSTGRLISAGYCAINLSAFCSSTAARSSSESFFHIRPRVLSSFSQPARAFQSGSLRLGDAGLLVVDEFVGDTVVGQPVHGLLHRVAVLDAVELGHCAVSHHEAELAELRADRELAVEYLKAAMESLDDPDDRAAGLLALRTVAEAYGGLGVVAAEAGISRESLYRALSPKGNPTLKTLLAVLKTVGLRLSVEPDSHVHA
jgi:probable addiction module antidote protein